MAARDLQPGELVLRAAGVTVPRSDPAQLLLAAATRASCDATFRAQLDSLAPCSLTFAPEVR